MSAYEFRFLDKSGTAEAGFTLEFATDELALETAWDLRNHSPWVVLEVRKGSTLLRRWDRAETVEAAQ
jgi:hypothetical protein